MPVNADDTVKCIDCAHFRLKDAGQMGKLGFGLCAMNPSTSSFQSSVYPRQCAQWRLADEQTLGARRAWMEKREGVA
ncbi:hypothetical protein [Pandoraea apista]|jgi:hypothetical protein|uniref:hypothetical protein n=1 Tax=Pandoraea apista TaxID=93218 RepID=UPI00058A8BCF|nr:hypothetical protein [Pandoraea apista]AJE99626.1 hypothetical protein SG18_18035 [Pandoraea apista]AKH73748.1 hypothetical protein XM39_18225 [Pandoraea apista]AKI62296.1 hypothetical protein AA956_11540 [Pandoraea apista]